MPLHPGARLGPYEIVAPLGAGGMGEVYRARDTRLDRAVAIKVLPREVAGDPDRLRRFEREARATAALSHPNILAVHDVGTYEGAPFLVEELLEGESLAARLRGGRLTTSDATRIGLGIARGLAAAHERGVVHRDLKPANVFLTADGGVKLLDFGLARLVAGSGAKPMAEATTVAGGTELGTVLGTAAYMAPEQARGLPVDPRADVFAFGVALHEMLTGARPFRGETTTEMLAAILRDEPPPLPTSVPAPVVAVVDRCLAKEPSRRYATGGEVVAALESAQTATAATPRTVTSSHQHRWMVVVAAALAAAVAVLLAFDVSGLRGWIPDRATVPSARLRLAVLPFENLGASDDAYFAAGMTDEISGRLATLRGLAVVSRTSVIQYAGTTKTTRQIGDELGATHLLTGTVRWARAPGTAERVRITPQLVRVADDTSLWAEVYDSSIDDIFRVQSEIAGAVVEQLDLKLLAHERAPLEARPTANLDAYQVFLRGRFAARQPHFTVATWLAALEDFRQATVLDPDFALAWAALAEAHARLVYYRYDLSPERREHARRALERARELAPDDAVVHLAAGYYHLWVERDPAAALVEFEDASTALPNDAEVLTAKGELYRLQGEWQRSLETFQLAASLSPRDAQTADMVAETLWWMHRHTEAQSAADRAIELAPDQAWPHLSKVFNLWTWKGRTGLSDARQAAELVPKAHEWWLWTWFWQEVFEGHHEAALVLLGDLPGDWVRIKIQAVPEVQLASYVHAWRGESQRARRELETARRLLEAEIQAVPEDGRYHSSLGVAYAALGRREEALREGRKGVELLPLAKDPLYGVSHVLDLAHIFTLLDEPEQAVDQLELLLARPGWVSVPWLEMDPRFAALRDLPRYRALCERYRAKD